MAFVSIVAFSLSLCTNASLAFPSNEESKATYTSAIPVELRKNLMRFLCLLLGSDNEFLNLNPQFFLIPHSVVTVCKTHLHPY
ncbi:hypothetical protein [Bacillus subtilis]|uniref:hypothetical protein n=1 Tax=Bacillus subtilis TaxID=1423 RepID=UPI003977C310